MNISPAFRSLLFIGVFTQYLPAEEEVWYNAAGDVVKVTEAKSQSVSEISGTENKPYTSSALYALHGGEDRGVQRFRTGYAYPHYYQPPIWRVSPYPYQRPRSSSYNVSYRGKGWSFSLGSQR